ncbi:MAG: response regulator transcription factor [Bacteroidetes bacterium]|nr:response regulator transcription factor [Bacteroidota bacterium]
MPKIKVAIVEDLEEVLEGLSTFVKQDADIELVAAYRTAEAAALELPIVKPDIVIMDINLPGITGIECIKRIKAITSSMLFMMFTVYENNDQVFEALKAGASGYLLKKTSPSQIIEAIKELYNGGSPMSSQIARKLVSHFQEKQEVLNNEAAALSSREKQVLENLARGMLYKEIADQLGISFHTVRQHIGNIYEKLHVQNKTEAINKVYGKKF